MPKCTSCGMEFIDRGDGRCSECGHSMRESPTSPLNAVESINGRDDGRPVEESSESKSRSAQFTDYVRLVPPKIGLLAFAVLAIFGLGGHFVGLRTIGSYSEVRADIRGSEQLISELKTNIAGLNQDRSQISAGRDAAQTELISLQSQVTEAKTTKTLALESVRSAQEDMAKARQSRIDSVNGRDSALAARDKANRDRADLLKVIESLTTQEVSLKQSVQTLEVSRANLDTTLKSLARESQTLSDIRQQLDTSRRELDNVERRRAVAEESLAIAQTTKEAADRSQADIQALTTQRSQLNGIVAELRAQIKRENETLSTVTTLVSQKQAAAATADGQLASAQRERGVLDKEVSNLRVERDQLIPQIGSLETQVNELRGTVSGLEARLTKLRTEELDATSRVAEATFLAGSIDELRGQQDKLQTEIDSFITRRTILQREDSVLDAKVQGHRDSISRLNEQLQRLLKGIEAALKARNSVTPDDDQDKDSKDSDEGGE